MAEGALNVLVELKLAHWHEGEAPPSGGHRPRWLALDPHAVRAAYTSYSRPGTEGEASGDAAYTRDGSEAETAEKCGFAERPYEAYAPHSTNGHPKDRECAPGA